jgi:hypothetical protein
MVYLMIYFGWRMAPQSPGLDHTSNKYPGLVAVCASSVLALPWRGIFISLRGDGI